MSRATTQIGERGIKVDLYNFIKEQSYKQNLCIKNIES